MNIPVVIEHDSAGFYAHAPTLPGCQTQGPTMAEALKRIEEAIVLYVETLSPAERHALRHQHVLTTMIEVQVA